MRRFNGTTLAMKTSTMRGSDKKHLCKAGLLLAFSRDLAGRLGTWREPMKWARRS